MTVRGAVRGFEINLRLCDSSGSIPLSGLTSVSAWFYVDGPAIDSSSYFGDSLYTDVAVGYGNIPYTSVVGQWFQVSTAVSTLTGFGATNMYEIGVQGYINGTADWDGTIYVDDFVIQ